MRTRGLSQGGYCLFLNPAFFFSVFEFLCVWGDNTAPQQWPFLTHLARSRHGEHSEDRGRKNNCLPACWETLQARQRWWWREDRWMKVTGEVDNNPSDYVWLEDYPLTCLWPPKALHFSFCIINSLLMKQILFSERINFKLILKEHFWHFDSPYMIKTDTWIAI